MKFLIRENGIFKSRLGRLQIFSGENVELHKFETPTCLLYTEGGNVPHLTHNTLQKLTTVKHMAQLPLPNIIEFEESLTHYKKGIAQYIGLTDYPLFISVSDPAKETKTGFNVKKSIAVWSSAGKNAVTVERFMKLQESFHPHMYQSLCDSDTPKDCSNKRITHSVGRSIEMLDQCLEIHSNSDILKNVGIFGTIQGGYQKDARTYSATQTALRPVDGFVIEGLHSNGPEVANLKFEDAKDLIEEVISHLPNDKPRILPGAFHPQFIINAILSGIDMFDGSYPYLVTERGCASIFTLEKDKNITLSNDIEINLEDSKYKEDFSPILDKCECYTCKNFTKAYINHLITTMEMLGSILLMMHNVYHFLDFFKNVRNIISLSK